MTQSDDIILRVRCLLCCKIIQCNRSDTTPLLSHIKESHPEVTLKRSSEDFQIQKVKVDVVRGADDTTKNKEESSESLEKMKTKAQKVNFDQFKEALDEIKQDISATEQEAETNNKHVDTKPIDVQNDIEVPKPISKPTQQASPDKIVPSKKKQPSGGGCKCDPCPSKVEALRAGSACSSVDDRKPKDTQILYKRKYKPMKPQSFQTLGKRKLYKTTIEKWKPGKGTVVCPACGAQKKPIIKTQVDKVSHSPLGAAFILTCWPFCFLPCLFPPPAQEFLHCSICNHYLGLYDRKAQKILPNENPIQSEPKENSVDASGTKNL